MQGDACCVLFELFAFDGGVSWIRQGGRNPNPLCLQLVILRRRLVTNQQPALP